MTIYRCSICKREFNRKCNFDYHVDKKRPCYIANNENPKENKLLELTEINNLIIKDIDNILNIDPTKQTTDNSCIYCDKKFCHKSSLNRHLKDKCNLKKYYYEIKDLKEKMKLIINNDTKPQQSNYINNIDNFQNTTVNNSGVINNNVNIQLVQFGNENIDELDLKEAIKVYLESTGGNIISNVLKYVNLNSKYPQNHNICMTDLSREIVKIFNGEKFITKKFKNIKEGILNKTIDNIYKIINKAELNNNIKKNPNLKKKLDIHDVSLKLIKGMTGEEIVREELIKEKLITDAENKKQENIKKAELIEDIEKSESSEMSEKTENSKNSDYIKKLEEEKDEEIEYDSKIQKRIEFLDNKIEGLQKITYSNLKEELYNGKRFL